MCSSFNSYLLFFSTERDRERERERERDCSERNIREEETQGESKKVPHRDWERKRERERERNQRLRQTAENKQRQKESVVVHGTQGITKPVDRQFFFFFFLHDVVVPRKSHRRLYTLFSRKRPLGEWYTKVIGRNQGPVRTCTCTRVTNTRTYARVSPLYGCTLWGVVREQCTWACR